MTTPTLHEKLDGVEAAARKSEALRIATLRGEPVPYWGARVDALEAFHRVADEAIVLEMVAKIREFEGIPGDPLIWWRHQTHRLLDQVARRQYLNVLSIVNELFATAITGLNRCLKGDVDG